MHSLKCSVCTCAKALAASGLLMAMSTAQGASEGSAEDWLYGLVIYGWLPSVSGDLKYSPSGSDGYISADAQEIIDSLELTFMARSRRERVPGQYSQPSFTWILPATDPNR